MLDICIIGGGASGMCAAVCAKEADPSLNILILEKKNQLGKKLLATGNGRCNLSNTSCPGCGETLKFFGDLGILTRTDSEGRVYPYTEEARSVHGALTLRLQQLGVQVQTLAEVVSIEKKDVFEISLKKGTLRARKVLIACGGKAGSAFGTTGDGFRFARQLGHRVEKPVPVLTAVDVRENVEKLSGIRVKAAVMLIFRGKEIFRESGEVQFTRTGISGICVFNLSRYLLIPNGADLEHGFDDYQIQIDFFPDREDLQELLAERAGNGFEGEDMLRFLVRKPLADMIYASSKGDVAETARLLKAFPLSPRGVKGWDFAQVTKGGVSLEEVDMAAQQSRLVDGLYFAGEVLDYDGPCGGYNLQFAWESGMRAGKEMAR
ncbi:MAG: aminoacetone oxidase family FAD-binding enzyme [Emergencia sp.]